MMKVRKREIPIPGSPESMALQLSIWEHERECGMDLSHSNFYQDGGTPSGDELIYGFDWSLAEAYSKKHRPRSKRQFAIFLPGIVFSIWLMVALGPMGLLLSILCSTVLILGMEVFTRYTAIDPLPEIKSKFNNLWVTAVSQGIPKCDQCGTWHDGGPCYSCSNCLWLRKGAAESCVDCQLGKIRSSMGIPPTQMAWPAQIEASGRPSNSCLCGNHQDQFVHDAYARMDLVPKPSFKYYPPNPSGYYD